VSYEGLLKFDVFDTVGGGQLISSRLKEAIVDNFPNEVQLQETLFTYQ
jgi:hypothetical protein